MFTLQLKLETLTSSIAMSDLVGTSTLKKYELIELGEWVQVDHMTVTKHNVRIKHFQAWDRRSRFIHAQAYGNAKASTAKKFLLELIDKTPFPILSIQVDGGSEFRAEFEQACAELGIELIVFPLHPSTTMAWKELTVSSRKNFIIPVDYKLIRLELSVMNSETLLKNITPIDLTMHWMD